MGKEIKKKEKKEKSLRERLGEVVMEYTRQVANLMDRDMRYVYWVGVPAGQVYGTFSICDLGDTLFLTLEEMQVLIDDLDKWVARYSTPENVAEEVVLWSEWNVNDKNMKMNLRSWLLGAPRLTKKEYEERRKQEGD